MVLFVSSLFALGGYAADKPAMPAANATHWNPTAAARYLDSRATWWESWPAAQRDHDTACVSCHTMLPYALARPGLRKTLGQTELPAPEAAMLRNVKKRVSLWQEVQPYYLDAKSGPGKSRESRATEAVLNALILSSTNQNQTHLDEPTRAAFDAAWALQLRSGDHAGAWDWQVFHLAPWESSESQYQGASFMALALALAPRPYQQDPAIRPNLQLLRSYLKREYPRQNLLNRTVLLWASTRLPGLLSKREQRQLAQELVRHQNTDGGWNLPGLGSWTRSDHTDQDKHSDGYATGLVTLVLEQTRRSGPADAWKRGRTWLEQHQNPDDGSWRAYSLNKNRDLTTNVGRFMTDAATGFAVLALNATR